MKILVINGPNINMLGIREPNVYGRATFAELEKFILESAEECGVEAELFQSNHEGAIVDKIQEAYGVKDGIVIIPRHTRTPASPYLTRSRPSRCRQSRYTSPTWMRASRSARSHTPAWPARKNSAAWASRATAPR